MAVSKYQSVTGKEIRVHVGQTGQKFSAEIGLTAFTLSGQTRQEFAFKAPDGTITRKAATEVGAPNGTSTDFTDKFGNVTSLNVQLKYTVDDAALFSAAGVWSVWIEVDKPGEVSFGTPTELTVFSVGSS